MRFHCPSPQAFISLIVAAVATHSGAAEIRLRQECQPEGNLVLLRDVADIYANDVSETRALGSLELIPTPAPGTKRYLRAREIQDILNNRGINMALHKFSGARQVNVDSAVATSSYGQGRPVTTSLAERIASEAILRHLQAVAGEGDWEVRILLGGDSSQKLTTIRGEAIAQGGSSPWAGRQQFVLIGETGSGQVRLPVEAEVTRAVTLVQTTRPLPRGAVVQVSDLRTVHGKPQDRHGRTVQAFHTIDEVIGQETTRAIAAGQTLDAKHVRKPVLVRQGEVVTVIARTAGIRVETKARARQSGALDDLITLESLLDRSKFFARVTGIQTAEAYARAASVGPATGESRRSTR